MSSASGRVTLGAIAAASLALAGCGIVGLDSGPQGDLDHNRALWTSTRPDEYTMTLERTCFCSPQGRGPVRITVRGQAAAARVYVESGEAVPLDLGPFFPTVDGLFDLVGEALDQGAYEVRVQYDEATGVPYDVWIDYDRNTADEEVGYAVLLPLTPG